MSEKKIVEEAEMFEITEKASDKLKELLKDREDIPGIRIVLSQGG
jgi:Fe-S cluster assembly iron-binding protein IscA